MNKLLIVSLFFFCRLLCVAQPPDYDDLKILYADGKYEKLVGAAEKYTQKENLAKDPFPYLWLAKGLYKITFTELMQDEKYKGAYKDAIGALAKVIKLDKDSACINTHKEFIDEFQLSISQRVEDAISANKIKDAAGWATKYYKITKNPIGAKYIEGAAKYKAADKGTAATIWKDCEKMMTGITDLEGWSEADKDLFRMGILQVAECYIDGRQKDKAVTLLNKVAPWFEEDEDFKTRYDEIVN